MNYSSIQHWFFHPFMIDWIYSHLTDKKEAAREEK